MPGLLMGLLQIGWFAVATFFAADFILKGLGVHSEPMTTTFVAAGVVWGCLMAWVGVKGIRYVAKISLVLNAIPLLMLLIVFFQTAGGIPRYQVPAGQDTPFVAFTAVLAIVIGFFATGGAAGADFWHERAACSGRQVGRPGGYCSAGAGRGRAAAVISSRRARREFQSGGVRL
jgi:cytosine permease